MDSYPMPPDALSFLREGSNGATKTEGSSPDSRVKEEEIHVSNQAG
jgi:hypothetical protein